MLKIRLQRTGRKHETTFRIVATDSKNSTKSGKILETLGAYDPRRDSVTVINAERVKHWISVGAGLSGTINNLLISKKIIDGKKVNVLPKKTFTRKKNLLSKLPLQPKPLLLQLLKKLLPHKLSHTYTLFAVCDIQVLAGPSKQERVVCMRRFML